MPHACGINEDANQHLPTAVPVALACHPKRFCRNPIGHNAEHEFPPRFTAW